VTVVPGVIDVHRHAQPPECIELMLDTGRTATASPLRADQLGAVNLPEMLREFDECGIAAAILQGYGAHNLVDGNQRASLAGLTNDFFAELIARAPVRVGAVAALPLPDIAAALAEIGRALDDLGLDGVVVNTSYAGRYFGDPMFAPVLAELDRRGAVTVVHPVQPTGVDLPGLDFPVAQLEFPFETTRMIANMLVYDTILRYPRIRFLVPHAGGSAPYLPMRLAVGLVSSPHSGLTDFGEALARVRHALAVLHYDIAVSAADVPVTAVLGVAGQGAVLFGSDCPPGSGAQLTASLAATADLADVDDVIRARITRTNALKLFPRFCPEQADR
jgi:predicted TIM-barrel fold metal-dependent hydrolase